jgi:hypothetical protein
VVRFTPRPLYPEGKSSWNPLDRRLGGPQSRSGHCHFAYLIWEHVLFIAHADLLFVETDQFFHPDGNPSYVMMDMEFNLYQLVNSV